MPSKAYMAKRLVELGHRKSVSTLRRYPVEQLASMLAELEANPAPMWASAPVATACSVPSARTKPRWYRWVGLTMLPLRVALGLICAAA